MANIFMEININEKHFNDDFIREDYDNTFNDYDNSTFQVYEDFLSDDDYYPDFPTCFVAQTKVKNFQVICYLKFFPEERSKKLDSNFFTMFEKSKKPGVFWAHCDLASQISQFVSPVHVSNGTVQVTFTGELSYLLMRAVPYKWWIITDCGKIKLTSKWKGDGIDLIVLYEAEKKFYHYYTERTFKTVTHTFVENLQIFYLPMKNYQPYFYSHDPKELLTYECI